MDDRAARVVIEGGLFCYLNAKFSQDDLDAMFTFLGQTPMDHSYIAYEALLRGLRDLAAAKTP